MTGLKTSSLMIILALLLEQLHRILICFQAAFKVLDLSLKTFVPMAPLVAQEK